MKQYNRWWVLSLTPNSIPKHLRSPQSRTLKLHHYLPNLFSLLTFITLKEAVTNNADRVLDLGLEGQRDEEI